MATYQERNSKFANSSNHFPMKHPMAAHFNSIRGRNAFASTGAASGQNHFTDTGLSALASGMGTINLGNPNYTPNKSNNTLAGSHAADFAAQPLWLQQQQAQMLYVSNPLLQATGQVPGMHGTPALYSPVTPYLTNGGYGYGHQVVDGSPLGNNWRSDAQITNADLPILMTPRRDSASSTEQDIPATPYTGYGMYSSGVAIMERSPSGVFTSAAASPSNLTPNGYMGVVKPTPISTQLDFLLKQDPHIPRAIPAPNSPLKPLDRCLENRNGETNVYIRGLHPETTDKMLEEWGKRFGDIQSSKSIIDMKTNLCKGFGFIKYYNFEDAENCIRGFHHLGYEVSFARESFYAKLKKFSDDNNTNLYVSNIPKNMNEHELGAVFVPYKVCSSRILRDPSGNGRGVGFARFESRDVCEKVIKQFNNTPVRKQSGEEHLIQIRYSDTHEQKLLKQQTAAGRQFRAAEYDLGVAQARGGYIGPSTDEQETGNEFEQYLRGVQSYVPPVRFQRQIGHSVTESRNLGVSRPTSITSGRSPGGQSTFYPKVNIPVSPQPDGAAQDQVTDSRSSPVTPTKAETTTASIPGLTQKPLADVEHAHPDDISGAGISKHD